MVAPIVSRQSSHARPVGVTHQEITPVCATRLSHIKSTGTTGADKMPPTLLFLPSCGGGSPVVLGFSRPMKSVVAWIDSMSWYPYLIGYVCRRYQLIWLIFEIFVAINWCGRVSRLIECLSNYYQLHMWYLRVFDCIKVLRQKSLTLPKKYLILSTGLVIYLVP
jgi:hypothetical protein